MSNLFIGILLSILIVILFKLRKSEILDKMVISTDLENLLIKINNAPNKGIETIYLNKFKNKMTELYELEYGTNYVLGLFDGRVHLLLLDVHAKHILGGVITPKSSFREFFNDKICILQ